MDLLKCLHRYVYEFMSRGYKTFKFVLLIYRKLPIIANSFLRNIAEYVIFSANKYENANKVGIFLFISREISCSAELSTKKVL